MREAPLSLFLEFARAEQADDPYGFRFAPQEYLLRGAGGGFESGRFAWDSRFLAELEALRLPGRDPACVQSIGETLRRFLSSMGFAEKETQILATVHAGRRLILTIRSAAAELYALPWELLTLRATGQHVGELAGVLLRFEWPETRSVPEPALRDEGGRILFAWSAAGGAVPAPAHVAALRGAAALGAFDFSADRDALPHASCGRLTAALAEAERAGRPVAVLHLLCHGGSVGSTFGLVFDGEEPGDGAVRVDAGRLRQLLAPHAATLRLVMLCACDSANSGALGNQLGSIAQTLHRAGIAAVVASRFPLSVSGSIRLTETFYRELLAGQHSVEDALVAARCRLAEDADEFDWASLQLYARAADGDDTRPIIIRPYRGLLAFQPAHSRLFFGREKEIRDIIAELERLRLSGRPRLLVVDGASGSGKSSVVLAGVVPRLVAGPDASCKLLRIGSDMRSALDELRQERAPLLVIDQFEEIFTHIADDAAGRSKRTALARELFRVATARAPETSVILTMRSDFIGRCGELVVDEDGQRLDRILYEPGHRYSIAQLARAELRDAIAGPADAVGLALEPGLAERMIADVAAEPGALPLLADALDALWQKRQGRMLTQAAYDELGGVAGALTGRAERLVAGLDEAELRLARRLFIKLVVLSEEGGPRTRRRVRLDEARPSDEAEAGRFAALLDRLVASRLLVRGQDGIHESIEVAHEALLRRWTRLGTWLEEDQKRLRDLARLRGFVQEFEEHGTLLRGNQLGYALEVARSAADELPAAVHRLLIESEAARAREEEQARVARDAGRVLAAQQVAGDPTRVAAILREAESADPTRVPGWLAQVTTILHRGCLMQSEQRGQHHAVVRARISPCGSLCASAAQDGSGLVFRIRDGAVVAALRGDCDLAHDVVFSQDGRRVALALEDGTARVFLLGGDAEPLVLGGHEAGVTAVAFAADDRFLLTGSADKTLRLFELDGEEGSREVRVFEHPEPASELVLSPDKSRVALAASDGTIWIYSLDGQSEPLALHGHDGAVTAVAFSPDGRRLFSAGEDGSVRLWKLRSPGRPRLVRKGEVALRALSVSPDERHVATGDSDGNVEVCRCEDGNSVILGSHDEAVTAVLFSPDGRILVSAGEEGRAALWNPTFPGNAVWLLGHRLGINHATLSPSGRWLATASSDMTTRIWDLWRARLDTPQRLVDGDSLPAGFVPAHDWSDDAAATATKSTVSLNGRLTVESAEDGSVRIARGGSELRTLPAGGGPVTALRLSPDGTKLAVASLDRRVRIWNLFSMENDAARVLAGTDEESYSVSINAAGVVAVADSWTVRLFAGDGTGEGRPVRSLLHGSGVALVAFLPASDRLLTGAIEPGAWLWDLEGRQVQLIEPARGETLHAVSPELRRLATVVDGARYVWPLDLDPVSIRTRLWATSLFCLSPDERCRLLGESAEQAVRSHRRAVEHAQSAAAPDGELALERMLLSTPSWVAKEERT